MIQAAKPMATREQLWRVHIAECPKTRNLSLKLTGSSKTRGDGVLMANYHDPVYRFMWENTITINLDGPKGSLEGKGEIFWQTVMVGEAPGQDLQVCSPNPALYYNPCHSTPCHHLILTGKEMASHYC